MPKTRQPPSQFKSRMRGRPSVSVEKRAEMKNRIAMEAERLFRTEGYNEISMRRIAKEIGCSPMTLYKYYDAKIDILRTLWGNVFKRLFDILEQTPRDISSEESLTQLGMRYVEYWLKHPEHYRLVFMAEGVTQPDVSVFLDNPELIKKYGLFAQAISNLNPRADIDSSLKQKLDFFLSTLHGVAHNHVTITGYSWSEPKEQIKLAVKAIANAA